MSLKSSRIALFLLALPFWVNASPQLNEKLKANIMLISPESVVVFNRGLEDGLMVGTHGKILSSEGYIARGVCVKAGMLSSHWKLYRIAQPDLISKDLDYIIVGINDREIPQRLKKLQERDYSEDVPPFDESKIDQYLKRVDPTQRSDLPESLTGEDDLEKILNEEATSQEVIQANQLRQDFKNYRGDIYLAPLSRQSINRSEVLRFGGRVANEGIRYKSSLSYNRYKTKLSDATLDKDVIFDQSNAKLDLTIKNFSPSIDYYAHLDFRRIRYGSLFTPRRHIFTSPFGLIRHFKTNKWLKRWDIAYMIGYDHRLTEVEDSSSTKGFRAKEINGLRHAFMLDLAFNLSSEWTLENTFFYRPYQNTKTLNLDFSDNLMQNDTMLSYKAAPNLYLDYHLIYQQDVVQERLSNLPSSNTIYSLEIRYQFNI